MVLCSNGPCEHIRSRGNPHKNYKNSIKFRQDGSAAARAWNFRRRPLHSRQETGAHHIDYARQLIHTGVPTELHVYPAPFHAFDLVPDAAVTKAFKRDWNGAFERALR
jgi:acetyl esterase/lipase